MRWTELVIIGGAVYIGCRIGRNVYGGAWYWWALAIVAPLFIVYAVYRHVASD